MSHIGESRISHVIFDFGGTLISLESFDRVLKDYALSLGKELPQSFYVLTKEGDLTQIFCQLKELLNVKDMEGCKKIIYDKIMSSEYKLIAGADKLLRHLYENHIPMSIATNVRKLLVENAIEKTIGLDLKYFSYICGDDDPDVKHNKPAPDIYLVAAKHFKPPPKSLDNCVIFEDSLNGIEGAVASGMKTVLITERDLTGYESITDKVTLIVDSLANFNPEDIGLPPYKTE